MRHTAYDGTPDERAIRALQIAYCDRFDARDEAGYAAIYTADAIVIAPWGQEISGADKLRKAVRNTPPGGWHRALETTIAVAAHEASGVCRFEASDQDGTIDFGRYEDRYVRTAAGWRIARRRVIVESRTIAPPPRRAP